MIIEFMIAIGVVAGYQFISNIWINYKMEKDRPNREIFFEALARKHEYVCVQGHTDKTLEDFRNEIRKERFGNT